MSTRIGKQLALCGAPAGACGFRGRDWRRGQLVASFGSDGTMFCACGSEMRPFKKTRFRIIRQKSPLTASSVQTLADMTYEQWLDHHRAQPGGWLVLAAPEELLRATYEQRIATFNEGEQEQ